MKLLSPNLKALLERGEAVAMVTVADARGSTPREAGARMLVTAERTFGTIGGGRLEYDAMQEARRLLAASEVQALREVPLGPALGQCCGGHATVLIERSSEVDLAWLEPWERGEAAVLITRLDQSARKLLLARPEVAATEIAREGLEIELGAAVEQVVAEGTARRVRQADGRAWLVEPVAEALPRVVLFGAGHVGRALAGALGPLPCHVRWVDQRPELLREPPPGVDVALTDHPLDEASTAPEGAFAVVMTHSHDLDCEICEAFLRRGDFAFLGLIGSATKRARFEKRWRARGLCAQRIRRLVCPIGLAGISGKAPEVIAASAAAQLLMAFEQRRAAAPPARRLLDA